MRRSLRGDRAQARERGDAIRDQGDAVRLRPVRERREGEPVLRRQRILERDRAGEHAAVELGQHHVHGEIGGAEPARAVAPGRALGGGDHDLQHRHVRPVERRRLARLAAGGEGRGGDDDGGREPRQRRRGRTPPRPRP